jgi:murein L,D-transpeptidase YcbB/YkuD
MALSSARLSVNARVREAAVNKGRPLARDETSRAVEILQQSLVEFGFPMPISTKRSGLMDGIFGHETEATVKAFQAQHGLKADGMAGPMTLERLDALCQAREARENALILAEMNAPPPIRRWNAT